MTDPRPDPDSEVAGEPEYGNDTGFADAATGVTGPNAEPAADAATAAAGPNAEPAPDADDPGRGAD